MQALTAFHRRCVRAMCNVNLRSTRKFKIKTATLEEKIGVEPIKMSYAVGKLGLTTVRPSSNLGVVGAVIRLACSSSPFVLTKQVLEQAPIESSFRRY